MKYHTQWFVSFAITAVILALPAWAQGGDETHVSSSSQLKFGPVPNSPACVTAAAEHGDPSKGPSTLLLKFTSGCAIPMHWHTPTEQLMMVSGSARMQTQDGTASTLERGGFVHIPPKHPHQFTCVTACTAFLVSDGVFDIHYIDKSGKEIPAEQALGATKPKPAAKKKAM